MFRLCWWVCLIIYVKILFVREKEKHWPTNRWLTHCFFATVRSRKKGLFDCRMFNHFIIYLMNRFKLSSLNQNPCVTARIVIYRIIDSFPQILKWQIIRLNPVVLNLKGRRLWLTQLVLILWISF